MAVHFAEALTSPEFAAVVDAATIGILPVAALEPHGPHLPLSTDVDIARGHLVALDRYLPGKPDVVVLPLQAIGHSAEHAAFPGAFSHPPETLLAAWTDIAETFRAAGGRRLIVVSSHGGNSDIVSLLSGRLRARGMLAVTAAWLRFGQPDGLFPADEVTHGIHGGAIETALMLHYRPDAVRRDRLMDFTPASIALDAGMSALSTHGRTRFGWLSADLNPAGAVGNATLATAEKGAASADHALRGFAALVADVAAFDLERLAPPTS